MAATTQELMDNAKCLACGIPSGMQMAVLISLFAEIADVAADPQTLMDRAACWACVPAGAQLAVLISLAQEIVENGGGGGGGGNGSVLRTSGDPEGVLVAPTAAAIAYDPATGATYEYTGVAGGTTGWVFKV